jgi:hypothetical protein
MKTQIYAEAHIPRGSGDAEFRIMADLGGGALTNTIVLAVLDPSMVLDDPSETADKIARILNDHADELI